MDLPLVGIIVLNWNGWRDTIECLESLFQISYPDFRVIVVDNGSTDDSVDIIRRWGKENDGHLEIIELNENLGFARANNVGIKYAFSHYDPEYILILNNDTTVERDFLKAMVSEIKRLPNAALCAPQVKDYYRKKLWQKPIKHRLNTLTYLLFATQFYHFTTKFMRYDLTRPSQIYEAPGCCLLIGREAFERIGLFDENTFLGWEEFIIAERLRQHGYRSYFVPRSMIYHKVGQATARIGSLAKIRIFSQSEAYFQTKILKFNRVQIMIVKLVRFLIYAFMLLLEKDRGRALPGLFRLMFCENKEVER